MFDLNYEKLVGISSYSNPSNLQQMQGAITGSNSQLTMDFNAGVIEDFIQQGKLTTQLYREIYIYDSVCGPTVDLLSTLPFSEFSISGVNDKKILDIYESSLNELRVMSMMQNITISYLVLGKTIGSLVFDDSRGIFSDFILHNPDHIEFTPIPLSGYDPKMDLKLPPEMQKFLRSKDSRDREAQKEISLDLRQQIMKGGKLKLEPISTLYLARQTVPGVNDISFYSRVLPMWLIEKALIRGTIIGAWRRQRSILHLQVGDEDWEPGPEQLGELAQLFINADSDPIGAVVATRRGVETNDIRQGSDFWRVSDDWDTFANAKMRALGVNEAFLSGEASYSTMEVALSVFIENLKAYRDFITRKIFYEKIFLLLAKVHKFKKRTHAEMSHNVRTDGYARIIGSKDMLRSSKYLIPEVQWFKSLQPMGDEVYTNMLETAKNNGIPIPLRLMASATGISLDTIMEGLEDDLKLRKKIQDYKQKANKLGVSVPTGEDEGADNMWSQVSNVANELPDELILKSNQAGRIIQNHGYHDIGKGL